jgi:transcription initiation factor TFIIIB Brf1 subunit/transcription initiation factor TFIIB
MFECFNFFILCYNTKYRRTFKSPSHVKKVDSKNILSTIKQLARSYFLNLKFTFKKGNFKITSICIKYSPFSNNIELI